MDRDKMFISLQPPDEVISSLTHICTQEGIQAGWISGIGALRDVTLGFYDLQTRQYASSQFNETFELLNLSASISMKDDEIFVHAHVTLGRSDFTLIGGHLFSGEVSAAGEFILSTGDAAIHRMLNVSVGLPLWHFEDQQ